MHTLRLFIEAPCFCKGRRHRFPVEGLLEFIELQDDFITPTLAK